MVYTYSEAALQVAIAQLAQNVGWNGIGSSSFEVLVDVCSRFMREIGKCSSSIAAQYNRTQVNFDDVQMAFNLLGISFSELDDYYAHVDQMPFALGKVPKYTVRTRPPIRTSLPDANELKMRSEFYDEWLPSLRLNADGGDSLLDNPSKNGSETDAMDADLLLQQSMGGRVDEELLDKRYISLLKAQLGNDSKIGGYTELNALLPKYIYLSNQGQVLSYGTKEGGMLPEAKPPPLMPEDLKRAEEEEKRREEQIQKEKESDQAACQPLKLKLNSKDKKKMLDKYRKDPKQMKGDARSKELLKKAKKDKVLKSKMNMGKLSMKVVGLNKGLPMAIASPLSKIEDERDSFFKLDQEDEDLGQLDVSADLKSEGKLSELDKSNESILNTSLNSLDNALSTTSTGPRPVGRPKGSTNKKPKIMTTEVLEKIEKKREREKKRQEELKRKLLLRDERRQRREELERQKEEKRKERERKRALKMQQKTPEKRRGRPPKNRASGLLASNANKDDDSKSNPHLNDQTSISSDVLDMNTSNSNNNDEKEAANILVSLKENPKPVGKNNAKKTSRDRNDSLHENDDSDDEDDDDDDDDVPLSSENDSDDLDAGKKSIISTESENNNASIQSTPRFKSLAELKAMPEVVNKPASQAPTLPKKRGRKPKPKPPPPEELETLDTAGKRSKEPKSRQFVDEGLDSDLSSSEDEKVPAKKEELASVLAVKAAEKVDKPKPKVKEEEKKKRRKKPEIDAQELYSQTLFGKLTVKLGEGQVQSVSPIPILKSLSTSPPMSPSTKFKREMDKMKKEKPPKKEEKKELKKEEKREPKKVVEEALREDETKKFKKKAKIIVTPTRAARKEAMENCTVITQTVSTAESGNKVWICPSCSQPWTENDGTPMIGRFNWIDIKNVL